MGRENFIRPSSAVGMYKNGPARNDLPKPTATHESHYS